MKRKFSLNLAPIKVPAKTEVRTPKAELKTPKTPKTEVRVPKTPKDTAARPLPRPRRRDSCSPPPSPFICRRPLSSKTEAQLRAACALILENYKPSGHVFEDLTKPNLDFDELNRSMREKRIQYELSQQLRAVEDRSNKKTVPEPKKNPHKSGRAVTDHLPGADCSTHPPSTGRPGKDPHPQAMESERVSRRAANAQISMDRPKTAPMRNTMDSDDSSSLKTPLTSSTGYFYNNAETAPTSAAFSSSPGSKRHSRQCYLIDNPAATADAAAAEWMKQELERRRQNFLSLGEPPAFNNNTRPPSRSRSIRSELREYIRPLSRSASRDSMRSDYSAAAQEPERAERSSGQRWRSWTLHRKTSLSSFKDSRPNSSRGRTEKRSDEAPPVELNLNRELPPLPSLDQWEGHAAASAKAGHQDHTPSTHIANLMVPKGRENQAPAPAVARHKHRRSGSDSIAQTFPKDTTLYSPSQSVRVPRPKSGVPSDRAHNPPARYDSSITFDSTMDPAERSRHNEDGRARKHQHSKSVSNVSQMAPSIKASIDQCPYEPPNFSRKISMDVTGRPEIAQAAQTTHKSTGHDKMQKLRKAVSSWVLNKRKDKKGNGMDKPEAVAVKSNVMVSDNPALPPAVKY